MKFSITIAGMVNDSATQYIRDAAPELKSFGVFLQIWLQRRQRSTEKKIILDFAILKDLALTFCIG